MYDSTKRFSNRVENYVKYRPGYPHEIIQLLQNEINLNKNQIIADIGSGTGISSEIFLKNGNKVYGVEPNKEMRESSEKLLNKYQFFKAIDGTAEQTTLENSSIDIIVAAQALHWFNIDKSKIEFKRILKNTGMIVLIWNERKSEGNDFLVNYEKLINKYGKDYQKVRHRNIDRSVFESFFKTYKIKEFKNYQEFDFEGLKGRSLSSSYMPVENEPDYNEMIIDIQKLFEKNKINGKIKFEYDTKIYYGFL
jgi:ubiquinone/menaquinone biosynthesis C-methylase UbiE